MLDRYPPASELPADNTLPMTFPSARSSSVNDGIDATITINRHAQAAFWHEWTLRTLLGSLSNGYTLLGMQ